MLTDVESLYVSFMLPFTAMAIQGGYLGSQISENIFLNLIGGMAGASLGAVGGIIAGFTASQIHENAGGKIIR